MDDLQSMNARCFGAGCDARLAGKPASANPHRPYHDGGLWKEWRRGWEDVDLWWGRLAKPWHRVAPLPAVK